MTSPSSSEGELSESEKANFAERNLHNGSVDRKSRDPESYARSPIAQHDGVNERLRSWSRSPRRYDRSRSRSPFRNRKANSPRRRERSPRGAKRRRQSPDSRRVREHFDVRDQRDSYRGGRFDRNGQREPPRDHREPRDSMRGPAREPMREQDPERAKYQRSHISYADIDRNNDYNPRSHEKPLYDKYSRGDRSPKSREEQSYHRGERQDTKSERKRGDNQARETVRGESHVHKRLFEHQSRLQGFVKASNQQGPAQNNRNGVRPIHTNEGPSSARSTNQRDPIQRDPNQRDNNGRNPGDKGRAQRDFSEHQRSSVRFDASVKGDKEAPERTSSNMSIAVDLPPTVDEDALIEERRKRREAIKAKYKSNESPLIIQALQHKDATESAPNSPNSESLAERSERSVSPMISSPTTPGLDTAVASPMQIDVENDMDLAHRPQHADDATGQDASAADYDASMDMQEDRAKFKNVTVVEADQEGAEKMAREAAKSEAQQKKSDKTVDMFADDDEDDMFASSSPERVKGKSVPYVQEARALDRGMLDDWDDHQGYYKIILGELLDGRYHVKEQLGKGVFSGVVRALDTKTQREVAIKIIRNNDTMRKAGQNEIKILEKLKENDVEDRKHVIRFERQFDHKDHLCMVFENLSINLREVLKKFGRDVGINIRAVRTYAHQMFLALSLLKKCNILHADLKPDNMLVNEKRNVLKVCDLGSAAESDENEITPYLVSRFYRAPEIILGMRYDFAIDMWSVGCTLFELYTGKILFTGRSNNQMLRSIQDTRGKLTLKLLKKCEYAGLHFDDDGSFRSLEKDATNRDVVRILNFTKTAEGRDLKSRLLAVANTKDTEELKEVNLFADLLDRCLTLNPEKRITPSQALQHPFIQRSKPRQLMAPAVRRPVKGRG